MSKKHDEVTKNDSKTVNLTVKQLTFCGLAIALAFIASTYLKFSQLPYGGSVTFFSMLFICFIGYLYGPKIGITTGIAYGILQFVTEPYIVHPIQVVLDYPLAFGALGLAGFFHTQKYGLMKGYIAGVTARYIVSVISGCVFFGEYAAEGQTVLAYSLIYNGSYIIPEMILTLAVIPLLNRGFVEVKKMACA